MKAYNNKTHLKYARPSEALFEKIILAIKKEKKVKETKKLLFLFSFILILSVLAIPFTINIFLKDWDHSKISYLIYAVSSNIGVLSLVWKELLLSIFESFPFAAATALAINIVFVLFSVKLFLYKNGELIKFLKSSFVKNSFA